MLGVRSARPLTSITFPTRRAAHSTIHSVLAVAALVGACAGPSGDSRSQGGGSGGSGGQNASGGSKSGGNGGGGTSSGGNNAGGSDDSGGAGGSGGTGGGGSHASGGNFGSGGDGSGGNFVSGGAGSSGKGGSAGGNAGGHTGGVSGAGGAINQNGGAGGSGGGASGGSSGGGGSSLTDAAVDVPVDTAPSITYALPPPNQGMNQFNIPGCQQGVATSPGGGNCTPGQNACEGTKQGAQVNFLCTRFMLFSDEMTQAASDDGLSGFNYGVVGHDMDTGGIDGNYNNACCQCYQLVYSLPETIAQQNSNGPSAIPIPPPLVVQAFNTAAGGPKNFDVFMGAGGFGAFNACDPSASMKSQSGKYLYTQFPSEGEPGSGGVNAATQIPVCQVKNAVTTASLSAQACQDAVATSCSKFASSSTHMTEQSIASCKQSNDPNSYYHMNWKVYAKRVQCPTHLMEVTGCKLQTQSGVDAVNAAVKTPDQAAADASFKSGYTVTTMQDCCMPTCAWQNNVSGQNIPVTGKYNSFYACNQDAVPMTESQ